MVGRLKRRIYKYSTISKPLIGLIVGIIVLTVVIITVTPVFRIVQQNNITPLIIYDLLFNPFSLLKSSSGRTNVLILGIGGRNHEGPNLTDSMIVLSFDFPKHDTLMISIPRDIYLSSLKDKINSAYAYGQAKKKGGGLILAKSAVEEVIRQPMHYSWLIDFSGFKELVDLVGGVDINVKNTFDDYKYPIEGKENDTCDEDPDVKCRYEQEHFDKGWQHMDGKRALKYVRSRYADGPEGTDFARSKRQQNLILSLKDKILHHTNWTNLEFDRKLFQSFDKATDTDMNWGETLALGKLFLGIKDNQVRKLTIDSTDEQTGKKGYFMNPPTYDFNGVWVLIPRVGKDDFSEIEKYVKCFLDNPNCPMAP